MNWIRSEGGPLVCLATKLKSAWGGIERLTVTCKDASTDYDRACLSTDYTRIIPILGGDALILSGEGPLSTSIRQTRSGVILVVQILRAELDINVENYLGIPNKSIFLDPAACVELHVASNELTLFDSAAPGNNIIGDSISFRINPGRYRVLTQTFDPNSGISFLLHKFENISSFSLR